LDCFIYQLFETVQDFSLDIDYISSLPIHHIPVQASTSH